MMKKSIEDQFDDAYFDRFFDLEGKYLGQLPKIFFHYTNLQAFLSIVSEKKLRASRAEFLNDATEFRYGQAIVREQIALLAKTDEAYENFTTCLNRIMDKEIDSPFISCFCENGDLLSQWRGYSIAGQGISIGFQASRLDALSLVALHRVIYNRKQQEKFMFEHLRLIADCYAELKFDLSSKDVLDNLYGNSGTIEAHCYLLKDVAFREEREIRIIVQDFKVTADEIRFRARDNLIVPYIDIDLSPIWSGLIDAVILGPGPDKESRKASIEHFLKLNGLSIPVKYSECQFR